MSESSPIEISPNPLKSEHLRSDVKPIMVCVGTHSDYRDQIAELQSRFSPKSDADFVDYEAEAPALEKSQHKNAGVMTYVMSQIDDSDKFSDDYCDCTGMAVVGRDKKTGKEISFLTHQDPKKFLSSLKEKFTVDLREHLLAMKTSCEDGTIDAVIIGGNALGRYDQSIIILTEEIEKILDFKPVIISGEKIGDYWNGDTFLFDTQNRRGYLIRPDSVDIKRNFVVKPN